MTEWISVNQTPEDKDFIVYARDPVSIAFGRYSKEEGCVPSAASTFTWCMAKWWMKLPPLPNEEEDRINRVLREDKCDNCRFYDSITNHEGRCKRFPPKPMDASGYIDSPIVSRNDWCGEFRAGEQVKEGQQFKG